MTAKELTKGQIFITAENVTLVSRGRKIPGKAVGDLRFFGIDGMNAIAELAHMHCARVILPASAKVSPKT